ncbi:hypothetical protein IE81DRAFT_326435 [Ceraceosorus guamensis]|uniref:RNA polymerase II subunit A C-terminal domain phosphatase n=1 Tax=Ceraceosorus guamensis TaxID=1522189 RepID=A0A316VQB9_9BASI|nr:hypothetical protein IE81DRAFT_326435 [Ceraceosorus guamensis]PWN39520.1 hypothetical protein IE81DRAFT_326435 [Ceraceosorus guamensis]
MECSHPASFGGLCALCGAHLDNEQQSATSFAVMHNTTGLRVTHEEASRLDSEYTQRLLQQRKLALIVDLDQTVIHATVDPTVAEWQSDPTNPNCEALKGVGRFLLGTDGKAVVGAEVPGESSSSEEANKAPASSSKIASASDIAAAAAAQDGCWYFIKLRPGTKQILKSLSEKYELHVYTMGTRSYADCVCRIIDPDGSLFGSRILSRDENGSLVQKSLKRLFPMDTSMVVIIDDRADVWSWSPNLVNVRPYDFFVGIGDINATFLPKAPASSTDGPPSPESSTQAKSSPASSADTSNGKDGSSASLQTSTDGIASQRRRSIAEQEQADNDEARTKATESQKVAVAEVLDARPLARMQEALDEKVAAAEETASPTALQDSSHESGAASVEGSSGTSSTTQPTAVEAPTIQAASTETTPNTTSEEGANHKRADTAPPTSSPPPHQHAVLRDDDNELVRIQTILNEIHDSWFQRWDHYNANANENAIKPHVSHLISTIKRRVLAGISVVFSGIVPQGYSPELSHLWRQAGEFGAQCSANVTSDMTHLVIAKPGTAKVREAQRLKGVKIVWAAWIQDSINAWEKLSEEPYLYVDEKPADMQINGEGAESRRTTVGAPPPQEGSTPRNDQPVLSEDQADLSSFAGFGNGMDWSAADEEVDAFLADGDDEGEDENDDEDRDDYDANENDRTAEEGAPHNAPDWNDGPTPPTQPRSKRQRSPVPARPTFAEVDDGDGKRQRLHLDQAGNLDPSTQTSSFELLTQQEESTHSDAPSETGTDEEAMLDALARRLDQGQAGNSG